MTSISSTSSTSTSGTTSTSADQWVQAYMATEQAKLENLQAELDTLTLTESVFEDLESKVTDVRDAAESLMSKDDDEFLAFTATTTDDEVVTATASEDAAAGTYEIDDVVLAKAFRYQSSQLSTSWNSGTGGTITVNGKDITIGADASLSDVAKLINTADYDDDKGVKATVVRDSSSTMRLVLTAESTGKDYAVSIADKTGSMVSGLGLTQAQAGSDASFTINGTAVTTSSNNASDVVDGLTINLLQATTDKPVTITVAADTDAMKGKIQTFLTKLNDLNLFISEKSSSIKIDGTYTRGALADYSMYTNLRSSLSYDLQGVLSGTSSTITRLSQLGISMNDAGDYVISNEKTLKTALTDDYYGVSELLGGDNGLVTKMYARLDPYVKNTSNSTGKSFIQADIDAVSADQERVNDEIDDENDRLDDRENYYRDQYTRLQQAYIEATMLQERMSSLLDSSD